MTLIRKTKTVSVISLSQLVQSALCALYTLLVYLHKMSLAAMIKPAEANSTAPRRRCCGGRVILEDIDVSTVDVFPLALFNK